MEALVGCWAILIVITWSHVVPSPRIAVVAQDCRGVDELPSGDRGSSCAPQAQAFGKACWKHGDMVVISAIGIAVADTLLRMGRRQPGKACQNGTHGEHAQAERHHQHR